MYALARSSASPPRSARGRSRSRRSGTTSTAAPRPDAAAPAASGPASSALSHDFLEQPGIHIEDKATDRHGLVDPGVRAHHFQLLAGVNLGILEGEEGHRRW